ncbi:MAG: hypothetical protein ACOCRO_00710 [Halanaerobiales bacterium]
MRKNEREKLREIYDKVFQLSLLRANNPCDTEALSSIARIAVKEAEEILKDLESLAFLICENCGSKNYESWQISTCKECGKTICYSCNYKPEYPDSDDNICENCYEKRWDE